MEEYRPDEAGYTTSSEEIPEAFRGPIITKLYCMESELCKKLDKVTTLVEENLSKVKRVKEEMKGQKEEIKTLKEEIRLQREETLTLKIKIHDLEQTMKEGHKDVAAVPRTYRNTTFTMYQNGPAPPFTRTPNLDHRNRWFNGPPESFDINSIGSNISRNDSGQIQVCKPRAGLSKFARY